MMEGNQKDIFPHVPMIAQYPGDVAKQLVNAFVREYNSGNPTKVIIPAWIRMAELPPGGRPITKISWGYTGGALIDQELLLQEAEERWREMTITAASFNTEKVATMNQQVPQPKFTPGFSPHQAPESFAYYENETIQWGRARKIIQNSNERAQASKANEEIDELLDHTSRLHEIRQVIEAIENAMLAVPQSIIDREIELLSMIEDDIGDSIVCLIMVAEIAGLDLKNCLAKAYSEIKDRRGEMRSDGKFYKEVG